MGEVGVDTVVATRRLSLVVLMGVPFTEQNYRRSGVAYLETEFDVTVVDCNKWLYPTNSSLNYQCHNYRKRIEVDSIGALLNVISKVRPAFAIDCLIASHMKELIRLELSRWGVAFVVKRSGQCPDLSRKQLVLHLLRHNPIDFFRRFLLRLTKRRALTENELPPDIALVAGRSATIGRAKPRVAEIAMAADDVHFLNEARRSQPSTPVWIRNTILFIDDCIAEAKDYVFLGLPFPMGAQQYYALLRRSMDIVERACGCKVVVAAHPDGMHISGYAEKFGQREVHFGKTAALVLDTKLVLGHGSTALSFAVLEKIPVVLLTCRELHASLKGPHILAMKHALGAPLVFMDGAAEQLATACREALVDEERYEAYKKDFLVMPEGNETHPWGAFIKYASSYVDGKATLAVQHVA
jgi:hypothetical protein